VGTGNFVTACYGCTGSTYDRLIGVTCNWREAGLLINTIFWDCPHYRPPAAKPPPRSADRASTGGAALSGVADSQGRRGAGGGQWSWSSTIILKTVL
jgi:hypothetical protein